MPNWPPYCFIDGDRTVGIPSEFLPVADLVKKDRASIQGPALPDWKLEAVLPALRDRAVEFIARWPGVVKPESVCDQLVHQADLMATCAEILSATLPDDVGEDSFSLVPLLKGSTTPVREHAVSCSMRGVPGVRLGSWKYIAAADSGGWTRGSDPTQNVQLYDLASDRGERENLAGEKPERVAEMQALLERLITTGRSRPGAPQQNDVEVVRYPRPAAAQPEAAPAKQRQPRAAQKP